MISFRCTNSMNDSPCPPSSTGCPSAHSPRRLGLRPQLRQHGIGRGPTVVDPPLVRADLAVDELEHPRPKVDDALGETWTWAGRRHRHVQILTGLPRALDAAFVPDRLGGLADRAVGAEDQEPVEGRGRTTVVGDRQHVPS